MSWVAVAIGGSAVVGAVAGSSTSSKQAKSSRHALNRSQKFQKNMWMKMKNIQKPWLQAGQWATNALRQKIEAGPGDYTKSPGYEFRLGEGVKTLERGAAARGNLLSGAQSKALVEYG